MRNTTKSCIDMSENNHTNDNHVGVLHPSRPMNHEPESNESRSTVGNGPNEVWSYSDSLYPWMYILSDIL